MPVFKTNRNRVVADDPESADAFVQVVWFGPPQDGTHRKQFRTSPVPLGQYQQAVDWAVSMADEMEYPLYVVPMRVGQGYPPERLKRLAVGLTDQERGELRRLVVTTAASIMRDCDDLKVREAAYAVLAQTGVVDQ